MKACTKKQKDRHRRDRLGNGFFKVNSAQFNLVNPLYRIKHAYQVCFIVFSLIRNQLSQCYFAKVVLIYLI